MEGGCSETIINSFPFSKFHFQKKYIYINLDKLLSNCLFYEEKIQESIFFNFRFSEKWNSNIVFNVIDT